MKETNSREVNADDVEVLNLDDDVETTDATEDDLDEEVIPPVEEDNDSDESKTAQEDNEKETTDDKESTDESSQSDEGKEEAETSEDSNHSQPKDPAPVDGETSRERALRKEVERQKRLRRMESVQRMTGNKADPAKENQTDTSVQELLDLGYSNEEISNMEKAIDVIAQRKGYVKATTLNAQNYQQTVNTVTESFTAAHPEYLPQNDPGDVRWNRFEEILKSGIYNLTGKSSKELSTIFNKVHADVADELGEASVTVKDKQEAAQRQKIRSVSHSGGTKTAPAKPAVAKPSAKNLPSIFKGFEDDDF